MRSLNKYLSVGFLYFYVHFVTEVICFFMLGKYVGTGPEIWVIFLAYDMLAFVPQAILGYLSDRFRKIPFGLTGLCLLSLSLLLFSRFPSVPFLSLAVLCIGNACTHVAGAEATLRVSGGRLSHSAIFVSGGSFGVITGKILSETAVPFWVLAVLALTAAPFVLLAHLILRESERVGTASCDKFNYAKKSLGAVFVILLAVFIVAVRGYMGYGIPTSWKKTVWQSVMLFFAMGFGKAAGGIFADIFGARRVALISSVAALPFLMFGDNNIAVSLVGVFLFSMTMAITLGILVSVLKNSPGLAFGLTTIGLFLGTAPVFFFRFNSVAANCAIIAALTAVCAACFLAVMKGDRVNE